MHSANPCTHSTAVEQAVAGSQFVADFAGCACAPAILLEAGRLQALCEDAVRDSGLTPVATTFHQFEPGGATGVVLLAESHLAVHTWPERGFVSVDLYVCNFSCDNDGKAQRLLASLRAAFQPTSPVEQRIGRGGSAP